MMRFGFATGIASDRHRQPRARRADNFDALRLGAAALVLVGHGFVLLGRPAPRILEIPIHTLGVCVFFAISGYMIAGSWERTPHYLRFLWHRVLRIFPALLVVVLASAAILGPWRTTLPIAVYFDSAETYRYLQGIALVPQYDLPGVFKSAEHSRDAVNGSLWTLGVEFLCYLAVLIVGLSMRKGRLAAFVLVGAAAAVATIVSDRYEALVAVAPAAEMVAFFCAGSAWRLGLNERGYRYSIALIALGAWLVLSVIWPSATTVCAWVALPYCAIAFGRGSLPVIRSAGRFGDLSYGIYLWAYPVQQVTIDLLGVLPIVPNLLVVGVSTGSLALLSWHLVEKRALSMKKLLEPASHTGTAPLIRSDARNAPPTA